MASQHCCLLPALLTWPQGWPSGKKPSAFSRRPGRKARCIAPRLPPTSVATPLVHYTSRVLMLEGQDEAHVLGSSPPCDLAPACFSERILPPLVRLPLLGTSHLPSCQLYVLPPEAFMLSS